MKSNLFKDILQEKKSNQLKYSQGRVYLFLSVLAYYVILSIITIRGLKTGSDIDVKTLEIVVDALQWAILVMGSYVFGGKGLEVIKAVSKKKIDEEELG